MKRAPLWLMLCLAGMAGQATASPWSLRQLMESLAAVKSVQATFREEKDLAILQQPLETTGILRYRAPSYLKKQTLTPQAESYEVDEEWLVIDSPTEGRRNVNLRGYPLIRALVEAIRGTLAGDLRTLERYYQVQLQGQPADWTLRLRPTDKELAEHVNAVIIQGQDNRVLKVETLETDGDRSIMTVEPQ
jgi:outer membrane lipoprotein-sorting protein